MFACPLLAALAALIPWSCWSCLVPKKTAMIPGQVQVPITSSQKDSFLEALRRDVSWLAGERLMDYSLLTADSWRCSPQVA